MTTGLTLDALLKQGLLSRVQGDASVRIDDVKHDSRRVRPGDAFVAIPGASYDGASYVDDAVQRGATAVIAERELALQVPVGVVADPRRALGRIASVLQGDPTRELDVIGVTGTNGKTTVAYLLEAMLQAAGCRPAVMGTVSFRGPQGVYPATHTTAMADDCMRFARQSIEAGATHLILEVSSHALAQHRVDDVHFRVAAFTNLTQDHLDYHGDEGAYRRAKARLFQELAPRISVFNVDDGFGARLAEEVEGERWRCTRHADLEAEIRALRWSTARDGIRATVATPAGELALRSPLVGEHNLENLLVALGSALAAGLPPEGLLRGAEAAYGAPGRLERVDDPRGVLVVVDYAHTSDALARVLDALRPLTPGFLTVVFGAGGDRDTGKRPLMGRAAAERADRIVLTSDNPRSEPPEQILTQIESGARQTGARRLTRLQDAEHGYWVCSDRRAAIQAAIGAAAAGDTVLIAGKGHEAEQIVGNRRLPFDDRQVAREAIALAGGGE